MRSPRTFQLAEIASIVDGEVLGSGAIEISGLATLSSARAGDLSFLTRQIYRHQLGTTRASAVLLSAADRDATTLPRIVCGDPYLAYAQVAQAMSPPRPIGRGVHPTATVHSSATVPPSASIGAHSHIAAGVVIGDGVIVGAGCSIEENVSIGADCDIHANAVIYSGCEIGHRVIVHSGAVIGADGFGMARDGDGWRKIPQLGRVLIGNDVEIGANTTIDRGALDDTVIEDGVKLDNQIQIGHNVHIGAHCAFAGCVGVAGSSQIGRRCTIGGGSVVLGHLEICDDVHIAAASIVTKSINRPGSYAGLYPLQEQTTWARNAALLRNLEGRLKKIRPPGNDSKKSQ